MNNPDLHILERYLDKWSFFSPFIKEKPTNDLGLIVVIPCYNETEIIKTLESLENCLIPQKKTEVIVVINSSEITAKEIVEQNRKTKKEIESWVSIPKNKNHSYHTILIENIPKKTAGAGYARKIGMDEAINRFFQAKAENGVICSLDADAIVAPNYLVEVEKLFIENENCNGCSIYFEHAIEGNEFDNEVYRRITEYELHIRYYKFALRSTSFPYYHYTVGSCFAVSARAYCLQGGMNRKQAGEDFYFLQKIMPMGNFFELNSTTVYPSSRPSDRVPFGTGPIINQYLNNPEKKFLTYNFEAFAPLKKLFADKNLFYKANDSKIDDILINHSSLMVNFLNLHHFKKALNTINNNTANIRNFERRFFHWFDGFKVIKYLNYVHETYFQKQNIEEAASFLILDTNLSGYEHINTGQTLLFFRDVEKNINKL